MKKRLMPTFLAFIVLVLLLVYANYYETEEILPPGAQKPQRLIMANADQIDSLTWISGNKETLRLVKKEGKFRIEIPGQYDVEVAEVEGLLKHFADLKSEMVVAENATDTSPFGITDNSPQVKITSEEKNWQLKLGSKSPVGGSYYISRNDEAKVYLVPGYIRGDFFKTVDNVRNRSVFAENFGKIKAIELVEDGKLLKLEKRDAIEWYVEMFSGEGQNPIKSEIANAEAVVGLIQQAQNLRVSSFIDDEPEEIADYGFASPTFRIKLTNEAGKAFELIAGEKAGTETYFMLAGSKSIYAVLNTDLAALRKSYNDLRNVYLPEVDYGKLREIRLKDASGTIILKRSEKDWEYEGKIISDAEVKMFFDKYGKMRITQFEPGDRAEKNGLNNLEACDSVAFIGEEQTRKIFFGNIKGINLSLKVNDEIMVVGSDLADAFRNLCLHVRSATSDKPVVKDNSRNR
ncbi:MAG: hypothetical protein Kow0029_12800 [Candidatus Rifleibacteriota bacterium]